jgi:DNA-binding transcriptional regulator YdaS (Cro superfamily)
MDFYLFLTGLSIAERSAFAERCGTTPGRLRQIAYGNEPASPQLCVAIDRESRGAVRYSAVNDKWIERSGPTDGRKRIPMDWEYVEQKAAKAAGS